MKNLENQTKQAHSRDRSGLASFGLLLPGGGMLALLVAAPLILLIVASFCANDSFSGGFTLANYQQVFADGVFVSLMGKSVLMGLAVTLGCVLLAYPVAYGLAKLVSERARGSLIVLIIIPFFTSQLLLIYSMIVLLQGQGPLMSLLALFGADPSASILYTDAAVFLILLYEFLPYMVLCLYSAIAKIDDNQLRAAQTLGAGRVKRFTSVIFPKSLPGLLSGILLVFVPVTGSFVEPDLAGGSSGMMVGSLINSNFAAAYNLGRGAALSVLFLVILTAITLVINGLLRWAGKGRQRL
ncbi:MAG: ABC transporter permease [Clostridiales bacterium]|nr:ABC transporter permease [Clostridiales bacterium]